MNNQNSKIQQIDWDWLIILDGCRYDILSEVCNQTVTPVYNGGFAFTANWFAEHLTQTYTIPFFHGGQPIYSFEHNPNEYDERNHFRRVPHWEEYDWGCEGLSTSPPQSVIEVVKQTADPRHGGVIRFLQPHNPYKGLEDIHAARDAQRYETVQLRQAYTETLLWALEEINENLLPWLKGTGIITADHGQAFGEDCCEQYLHGPYHDMCECLTTVPWVEL